MSLAEPSAVTVKREAEFLSPSSGPGIIITQRESHALNSASVKGFKRSRVWQHVQLLLFHPKIAPETISDGLKSKIFLGGHAPRPP